MISLYKKTPTMIEIQYNGIRLIVMDIGEGKQVFSVIEENAVGNALTVKQPYASMLVTGNKKFEYRSWKLQDIMEGEILYIHAGMKVLEKKVNVSDELYRRALEKVEKENLFGCIVGCVVFGHPEKTTNGYAWTVKSFFKFDEPIRNVKGNLGIWKFKVCKETDKKK